MINVGGRRWPHQRKMRRVRRAGVSRHNGNGAHRCEGGVFVDVTIRQIMLKCDVAASTGMDNAAHLRCTRRSMVATCVARGCASARIAASHHLRACGCDCTRGASSRMAPCAHLAQKITRVAETRAAARIFAHRAAPQTCAIAMVAHRIGACRLTVALHLRVTRLAQNCLLRMW